MITGSLVGHGVAISEDKALRVPYLIIRAAKSPAAIAEMRAGAVRWKAKENEFWALVFQNKLHVQVAKRAEFTEEVLRSCADALERGEGWVVVIRAWDGAILGCSQYNVTGEKKGMINLQAISPDNLVGSPGKAQLRGIGTALLAAISQDFLARNWDEMWVKPFDEQAAVFWAKRGFGVCGAGGLLCVRGRDRIYALRGICQTWPESPINGEYIVCGDGEVVKDPSKLSTLIPIMTQGGQAVKSLPP